MELNQSVRIPLLGKRLHTKMIGAKSTTFPYCRLVNNFPAGETIAITSIKPGLTTLHALPNTGDTS